MSKSVSRIRLLGDTAWLVYLGLADLIIHLAVAGRYGFFRDELYYIACANRLAWGYVDHPPLSIALLAAVALTAAAGRKAAGSAWGGAAVWL